jgi:hypothetical protein
MSDTDGSCVCQYASGGSCVGISDQPREATWATRSSTLRMFPPSRRSCRACCFKFLLGNEDVLATEPDPRDCLVSEASRFALSSSQSALSFRSSSDLYSPGTSRIPRTPRICPSAPRASHRSTSGKPETRPHNCRKAYLGFPYREREGLCRMRRMDGAFHRTGIDARRQKICHQSSIFGPAYARHRHHIGVPRHRPHRVEPLRRLDPSSIFVPHATAPVV